ncbi:hypothetical protein BGZ70_004909, partial [Mortierella alpina]
MQQKYLSNIPTEFAFAMAGFKDKPVHLKRNVVTPSMDLQKKVFPFVEDALYPPDSPQHALWVERCLQAMRGDDMNNADNLYDVDCHDTITASTRGANSNADLPPQEKFLLMLARMRRIVLQDASELYYIGRTNSILETDAIFKSEEFNAFKQEVFLALEYEDLELPIAVHPAVSQALSSIVHRMDDWGNKMVSASQMVDAAVRRIDEKVDTAVRRIDKMEDNLLRLTALVQSLQENHHVGHEYQVVVQAQHRYFQPGHRVDPEPSPESPVSLVPNFAVIEENEKQMTVQDVWDERVRYNKYRETSSRVLTGKHGKHLNNRLRIYEEVEFISTSRNISIHDAINELQRYKRDRSWSTSRLVAYCRGEQMKRRSKAQLGGQDNNCEKQ